MLQNKQIGNKIDENGHQEQEVYYALGRELRKYKSINGIRVTTEEKHYNSISQVDWVKDANGNSTFYNYDDLGRIIKVINPDGTSKSTEYNADNNSVCNEDEAGNRHYSYYDSADRLKEDSVVINKNNPLNTADTYYQYDLSDNLIQETSPNGDITKYGYDDLGRLV